MDDVIKPPMVGRGDSIDILLDIAKKVLHGDGEVVFIAGEAGIGKSRLAEEFEKIAAGLGFQVLVGRCIPGTPTPYIPFQEAFKKYSEKQDMGLVHFFLGKEFDYSSRIELKSESEKTLFSTLEFLRKLSAKNPIILRIEDLQWVDSASVQIIHFIARNCHGLRVLMIGTYRTEEVGAVSGLTHPLLENLRVMRREGICKEINLQELSRDQVKAAIEGMLGGAIGNDVLQKISAECGGNPLFMVETVRLLQDLNTLSREDGFWKMKGSAIIEIPSTVKEVILRRIEKIPKEERRILDCGAVIGERFEPKIIEESLDMDELDLLEKLDSIEKTYQLVMEKDGLYQFGHELVKRVFYDQISPIRRRGLHRIVGEILERRMPDEQILGAISMHFYYANEKEKCIKYSLLAGESCYNKLAIMEEIPCFMRVLELCKDDNTKDVERMHALEMLGDANRLLMNYNLAVDYFDEFLKSCRSPRDRARVLLKLAWIWGPTRLGKGSLLKTKEFLTKVEESTEIAPIDLGFLFRLRMYCENWEGKYVEAGRYCKRSEIVFRELGESLWLESQLTDHVNIFLQQGKVKEAEDKLKEAEGVFLERPSQGVELDLEFWRGVVYLHRGEYEKSLTAFTKVEEISVRLYIGFFSFWASYYKSLLYDSLNDLDRSREEAFMSRAVALRTESDYNLIYSCIMITHSSIQLNKIDEAETYYKEAVEKSRAFEWSTRDPIKGLLATVKAELDATVGNDYSGAFQNAFELLKQGDYAILYEATARCWYGKILNKQGLHDKAREQYLKSIELYQVLSNEDQIWRLP